MAKRCVQWLGFVRCVQLCICLMELGGSIKADDTPRTRIFLNKWAVQIAGDHQYASEVATQHGFRNLGQIGTLESYYLFEHHGVVKRSVSAARHHQNRLCREPKVVWVEQQTVKKRVKRDLIDQLPPPHFIDPLWHKMWYLRRGASGGNDMKVTGAWRRGYTGKGVVVTILDDGIEHSHPDLHDNYDPEGSLDINGRDKDPMPRYNIRNDNKHGTRCAGEVAAAANNTKCAVGVAYHASIGGVRMLDGDVSDYVEAQALSLNPDHVDVYSASWGPDDNGAVVDGPAKLAKEAFIKGVLKGRHGKGSIYVWASGNGGSMSDSCSCDGYTNSIFTLSVSSASEHGSRPWYLEECASTLATTYSSGENYNDRKIITTDLHNQCTDAHTGTSASAPLAAGMCALALQANPSLTWRDMQYIVMMTARTEPLIDGQWVTNGIGRKVSHRYGYGLMDGEEMVKLAERWTTVPGQRICMSNPIVVNREIRNSGMTLETKTDGCSGQDEVRYLEHVQAKIKLSYSRRGDLKIRLTSPNGTTSTLLPPRKKDHQPGEFKDWPFMSVFYWGEQPVGTWTLHIENQGSSANAGILQSWQLILFGVHDHPVRLKEVPSPPQITPTAHAKASMPHPDGKSNTATVRHSAEQYTDMGGEGTGYDGQTYEGEVESGTLLEEKPTSLGYDCHVQCEADLGCAGPGPQHCIQCRHYRIGKKGPCVPECPSDYFATAENGECVSCTQPCASCMGPSPQHHCLSCLPGYDLLPQQRACVDACPPGSRRVSATECEACTDGCKSCWHSPDHCTDCMDGYELTDKHSCTLSCSQNQYRDKYGRCESCHDTCATCTGGDPHSCVECEGTLVYYNSTCIHSCPTGTYRDHDNRECRSCHPSCETCRGADPDQCESCVRPLKLLESQCTEDCPPGHFEAQTGICQSCDESCQSCRGPTAKDCLRCGISMFLQFGHCVFRCQDGYYESEDIDAHTQVTRECRACHHTCETCTAGDTSNCISCKEGLLYSQGECGTECKPNEYADRGSCTPCHTSCSQCSSATQYNCTACDQGVLYFHGQCLLECLQGFYPNQLQCMPCHASCSVCFGTGGGDNECKACWQGHVLTEGGTCVPESHAGAAPCGTQQYYSSMDQICRDCDASCDSCTGPGIYSCVSCALPRVYYEHMHKCLPCCSQSSALPTTDCCICTPQVPGLCEAYQHIVSAHDTSHQQSPAPLTTLVTHAPSTQHPNIPFTHHPGQEGRSPIYTTSPKETITRIIKPGPEDPYGDSSDIRGVASSATKPWSLGVFSLVVCLCVASVLLFFLIFGILQARSGEKACWRHVQYQPVPTLYQNGTNKVKLTPGDYADEDTAEEEEAYSSA